MKHNIRIFLILALIIVSSLSYAATKTYSFSCNTRVIRGPYMTYEYRTHNYQFSIEVISDNYGRKPETYRYNHPFILAYPQERYSIRIHNPMPVRVAVNLMIDGLNSITGEPCNNPSQGRKWVLEPYSSSTIAGWQVDSYASRRFYFTSREESYAAWRSNQLDQDLTVKCGQISAAFFFSRQDMENYFQQHPIYEHPIAYQEQDSRKDVFGARPASPALKSAYPHHREAGTGMGERECNPVQTVHFRYDTGMYSKHDMIKIMYDFQYYGRPHPHPYGAPRPPFDYQDDNYAPEQP